MGQGAPDGSEFLTEDEVATRYRGLVAPGTLRNWRNKGFGPAFVKIGKGVLYPLDALRAWERQNTVACGLTPCAAARASHPAQQAAP